MAVRTNRKEKEMPKGEVPKSNRSRTEEQISLLNEVRRYFAVQNVRKAQANQIRAMVADDLIPPEQAAEWIASMVKPLISEENRMARKTAKQLKGMPIWEGWLRHVRGVDVKLGAQLIAHIQPIGDFDNVAKLWAYAGLSVIDGKAQRRMKGQKSNWNPELKTICFNFGASIEKAGGPYRDLYDRYGARDLAVHPEPIEVKRKDGSTYKDYSKGHMRNRRLRYAEKIFLSHLWQAWREMEGLPVRGPYAIEYLGHTTILSPWAFIETNPPEDVEVA